MGVALVAHRPAAELAGSRDKTMCPGTARFPVTASMSSDSTVASLHVRNAMSVKRRHTLDIGVTGRRFSRKLPPEAKSYNGRDATASATTGTEQAPDARGCGADSPPSLC